MVRSPIAFPASERPMIATVGPMTAAGMILLIHSTPTFLTTRAMITYTRPAETAPMISPRKPNCIEVAPAKAANIEPMKANEEPRKTGLLNWVIKRYAIVPAPAPKSAADAVIPFPIIAGTAIVAAMMASSCWKANTISSLNFGLS